MTFSIVTNPDGAVVTLVGELDVATCDDVREALDELVAARRPLVELDLGQLRMVDSIGIGLLIEFYKRSRDHGGEVVLREVRGQPFALFRLVHLDRVMMGMAPSLNER